MTETLRNNPNGLDLKQNQRQEVLASLSERIWIMFESEEMAKAYFAESMWSDLHEKWRKDNRFHKWDPEDFKIWQTTIKIDWIEYVFNDLVDGKWEFVITEAWKETAQQLWKDYESSVRYDYAPRMKKSKDPAWTQAHWTDDVDIANTKFEDLPSNYKYENLEAARVAIELVFDYVVRWIKLTDEMIEEMAAVVHKKWLERNDRVYDEEHGDPILAQEYAKLPEKEKVKDRDHIFQAIAKIKAGK